MRLIWGNYDPKTNSFAKTELVDLLVSEGAETRAEALRRLEIAGEDDLIPFLTDCITHYSPELRSAAARALTRMGDDSVLSHFMEQLSPNPPKSRGISAGAWVKDAARWRCGYDADAGAF